MRFTRLRRAIEDGTLIDRRGKQFQGSADKIAEAQKKRKKPSAKELNCDGDDEETLSSLPRKKKIAPSPPHESRVAHRDTVKPAVSKADACCNLSLFTVKDKRFPS